MLVMMLATGFYLIPEVNAIKAPVSGPVSICPTRIRGAWLSIACTESRTSCSITAIGGLALCWWEARE